jgi:hypothetical protein
MDSYFVQFEEVIIKENYISRYGEKITEEFPIHIRPVLKWIVEMVTDPIISQMIRWYPVKKFLVNENGQEAFRDDLDCGEKWWNVQVSSESMPIMPSLLNC